MVYYSVDAQPKEISTIEGKYIFISHIGLQLIELLKKGTFLASEV